jgi:hypothetical protein
MTYKYGLSSLNRVNINRGNTSASNNSTPFKIIAVRVTDIILDETHPQFSSFGEWNSIGLVAWEFVNRKKSSQIDWSKRAQPLFANVKNYPLINEVIYLFTLPNVYNINEIASSNLNYYINAINLFNNPSNDAIPNELLVNTLGTELNASNFDSPENDNSYTGNINLGKTFEDNPNIRSLVPYEGDYIIEGRFGNSIRFGSTVNVNGNSYNPWSQDGKNGDPILILRSGQKPITNTSDFSDITEDINEDKSSIYLASNQKIPLTPSSENYNSYTTPPESISKYKGEQIILNSGRLIFNSKSDSILLSSLKSINLNSKESVNIDSPSTVVNSSTVKLGSKEANEPILLGNSTVILLESLITNLQAFTEVCATLVYGVEGTPIAPLNTVSLQLSQVLTELNNQLPKIKSQTSFTK